jgi:Fe(3+) dicitrate transport protein
MTRNNQNPRRSRSLLLLGAGLCALGAAAPALAADDDAPVATGVGAAEAVAVETVIVVGHRDNLLKIPGSGATIEQADLVRSRVFSINEALRQAPGVFAREEEGLGVRPNIGIRGLSPVRSTKVLLLEDGLPLGYAPYGDNAAYYHPPIRRFDRIEVLKGASQIRFGPNSVGGVVNYVTPAALDEFGGKAFVAAGNEGYREGDLTLGGPILGFSTLAHLNAVRSDGSRDNQALAVDDLYLKIERRFGEDHSVSLRLNRFAEDSQITYSGLTQAEYEADPRQNPFVNDHFKILRTGAAATWNWRLSDALELKTSANQSWFDRDWWRQSSNSGQRPNDASDPACGGMANLNTTCGNEGRLREYNTYGLESRLMLTAVWGGVDVTGEIGARRSWERQSRVQINSDAPRGRTPGVSVNGGVREDNLRLTEATALFAGATFDFGRFAISPGIRHEDIDYERVNRLNPAAIVRGTTALSKTIPGLGATFELTPDLVVYGGWHRGFAPPRVEDIISNATGGAVDLDAETSDNYELGVRGSAGPGVRVDVALFRMDFGNQIVPTSVAGGVGSALTSAGETLHQGLEASLRGSLREMGAMTGNDLTFRFALTWVRDARFEGARFSSIAPGVSVRGNRLPYAPEILFTGAIGYAFGDLFDVQAEYVHTDEMFTDDLNTVLPTANGQRGVIRAHGIWNLTANLNPPEWPVGFFAAIKNAGNVNYVVDRARGVLPGSPRLMQIGLTTRF